tara:strand:+ start:89 stop:409 length:321 start_codon:yes stop_codon:yes gene_type:complete
MSLYEKISKKLGFKTKMSSTLKLYLCVDAFISILPFLFIDTKTGKRLVVAALLSVSFLSASVVYFYFPRLTPERPNWALKQIAHGSVFIVIFMILVFLATKLGISK